MKYKVGRFVEIHLIFHRINIVLKDSYFLRLRVDQASTFFLTLIYQMLFIT